MGHDIYGYKKLNQDYQIAYLRRSMWSNTVHVLYEALGVPEFDNDVSGSGESKAFSLDEINKAIATIDKDATLSEEDKFDFLKFLHDCLHEAQEEGKVLIQFA